MRRRLVMCLLAVSTVLASGSVMPALAEEVTGEVSALTIGAPEGTEPVRDADGNVVIGETGFIRTVEFDEASEGVTTRTGRDTVVWTGDTPTISTGNWAEYKVNVEEAGAYNLCIRCAASAAHTGFNLYIDGELAQELSLGYNSGGTRNWKYNTDHTVELPEGVHTLRLEATADSGYLNWLYFTKIDEDAVPTGVEILEGDSVEFARGMTENIEVVTLGENVDQHATLTLEGATDSYLLPGNRIKIGVTEEASTLTLTATSSQNGENGEPVSDTLEINVTDLETTDSMLLSRHVATQGMVLLKNENDALPLAEGSNVALLGIGSYDYVKGGGGSGDVTVAYTRNLTEALKAKQQEGKINLYEPLMDYYQEAYDQENLDEVVPEDEMIADAASFADTAVVVLRRYSRESADRTADKGDYYLSDAEAELITKARESFDKVVVVLNNSGMMDVTWDTEADALLMAYQPGMEGGNAIAEVLLGEETPAGKLTDTLADSYDAYPASENFGEPDGLVVNYEEDIYVGYRYFETIPGAKEHVKYPFGYGLSYTDFEFTDTTASYEDGNIVVETTVTNTGDRKGAEAVEVYFSAPEGELDKPAVELAGFDKTEVLEPGESETVTVSFAANDMSSYDESGVTQNAAAYVLEAGDYSIYMGNSVDNARENLVYTYSVDQTTVAEQLTTQLQPVDTENALEKRLTQDGTYEDITYSGTDTLVIPEYTQTYEKTTDETIMFDQVAENPELMGDFIAQLSDEQLVRLSYGAGSNNVIPGGNTSYIAGLEEYGIPAMQTADGPAGIRLTNIYRTSWPCGTLQASTWDVDLVRSVSQGVAVEAKEAGVHIWLAPGMNIHRDPLCGRNFEYYSEDPLIAGKMAASVITAVQEEGVAVTIKHFAANNKEGNRKNSDSRVSERALREIYLKGFEVAVKDAQPWCIMSSYNLINGVPASERYDLLTEILRNEWGYEGMVMSDWANTHNLSNEIKAGDDVKMPDDGECAEQTLEDLKNGVITRAELERNVTRMLEMILKTYIYSE